MTRQEQIKQAVESNLDVSFYTPQDGELLKETFYIGAKWADENPQSPWISVKDDLPCNHNDLVLTYNDIPFSTKRVLVMTDIHTLFLCEMKKDDDHGWIWNYLTKDKINHWFPIPELAKE